MLIALRSNAVVKFKGFNSQFFSCHGVNAPVLLIAYSRTEDTKL